MSYSISLVTAVSLLSTAAIANINALEQNVIENSIRDLRALALATEEKFSAMSSLMTLTSKLPQLSGASHVSGMTPELHGVPENVEVEKRLVAKHILSQNADIEAVAFILPDGEMYVEEPFNRQMNLTRTNFAFRDYFQGALTNNGAAYLGEVYISASSGASTSATAVPVLSKDGELEGVWIGLLHLQNIDGFAKEMFEGDDNRRFVYADQHGHEVVYSNELVLSLEESDRPLADMDVYKRAVAGESGWAVESIGSTEMFVAYHPVRAPSATWAVFSMQPNELLMKPVEDLRTALYSMIAIASGVGLSFGIIIAKKS